MSMLFGGGGSNPYEGQIKGVSQRLGGYAQRFGDLAGQAGGDYGRYHPQYSQALDTYAGLLRRNATDSDKAGYVNQMTQGVQRNFLAGQAGLAQNLAQRGLSQDSSVNAGGQAILEGQRAAALGLAGNQANQYFDERQRSNADMLQGLLGNVSNNSLGQQGQFLGLGQGATQESLSGLMPLYQNAEADRQQNRQGLFGLLGGLGQAAGGYFGGPAGGAAVSGLFRRRQQTPDYRLMGLGV